MLARVKIILLVDLDELNYLTFPLHFEVLMVYGWEQIHKQLPNWPVFPHQHFTL